MNEVHNGEQKEHKYLYFEIFYGGQKLHKYFRSLLIKDTTLLTCKYIGELRNGRKFKCENKPFIVSILNLRPFLTRKFFQEILGLESSKISWKCFLRGIFSETFPRLKFPQEKKARILPVEEIFEPKISWRHEEIFGSLDNRTEISTPSQYWMMPTAVCTHDCVLCCTHTYMHRVTQTLLQEP